MSDIAPQRISLRRHLARIPEWIWVVAISILAFAIVSNMILAGFPEGDIRFRIDLSRLLLIPVVLQIHIASAAGRLHRRSLDPCRAERQRHAQKARLDLGRRDGIDSRQLVFPDRTERQEFQLDPRSVSLDGDWSAGRHLCHP